MSIIHIERIIRQTTMIATAGAIFLLPLFSCAYRFTNLHVKNPNGISTVAIEGIYDTGSEVVAHDELWAALQKSFASNGHLKMTSVDHADALVRAHISTSNTDKAGNRIEVEQGNSLKKDPELYPGTSGPASPGQFRNLSVARDYYTKTGLSFTVDVEVWDTRLKKLILQRSYNAGFQANSVFGDTAEGSRSGVREMTFVRTEEILRTGLAKVSREVAEKVVTDLLVR